MVVFFFLWYMCGVGIVSVSLFYVSLVIAPVCNKQETITSFHWQYSPMVTTVSHRF